MANYIWQFLTEVGNPVPSLVPVGTTTSVLNSMASTNTLAYNKGGGGSVFTPVNIVKDFYWTNSKVRGRDGTGREEVPYIILKERKVKTSSFVAQALYSTGGIFDSAKSVMNALKIGNFNVSSATQISPAVGTSLSELLGSNNDKNNLKSTDVPNNNPSLMDTVTKKINEVAASATDDSSFLTDPWLSYYKGLYITQPTGWVYFLPFMSNSYQTTTNGWGAGDGDSGGSLLVEGASKLIEGFSEFARKAVTMLSVGSYQEKSKFYEFSKGGETLSISFPLINTGNATFDDVIRNWQFVFLLLYQNRAQRVDRNIVNPPPIYEVEIPGLKYMPLSYISNIRVEFRGSRRTMTLPIPSATGQNGTQGLETIVPEAYQISLDITSLVGDSKNFMYSTVFKNNNIVVMTAAERDAMVGGIAAFSNLQTNISNTIGQAQKNLFGG
tara:strand:+ start:10722 stop:12041 length:1320 start_codon:yes stop_codon:yes gene_type:complete